MAINKFQNYTFFTGERIEFYQRQGIGPNGAFVKNWRSKKWDQIRAIPVQEEECYRIIISFSTP